MLVWLSWRWTTPPTGFTQRSILMAHTLRHHHLQLLQCTSLASPLRLAWRLDASHDSMVAELFAILKALMFISGQLQPQRVVIYTDSQASLHLLLSRRPATSRGIVFDIQRLLRHLTGPGWEVRLQWVPSHIGILGNEVADKDAKTCLRALVIEQLPLQDTTIRRIVQQACRKEWDEILAVALPQTTLGAYRQDSMAQPWVRSSSRRVDVALTRLRIGHLGLNQHLHRVGLAPSPMCSSCLYQVEDAHHLLLKCHKYHSHRTELLHRLRQLNVHRPTLPTLLAAVDVPNHQKATVLTLTAAYLKNTGRINRL